jgi:hypothetical protein
MQPAEPFGGDPSVDGGSREHAAGRGRAGDPASGARRTARPDDTLGELLRDLAHGAGEVSSYLKTLGTIRSDRARLRMRGYVAKLAKGLATTAALAFLALCGTVLLVAGFAAVLGDWFDDPGLGDLVAGAVLLAIVGTWFGAKGAAKKRKELEDHRDKYARLEQEHRIRFGGYAGDRGGGGYAGDRDPAAGGVAGGAARPGGDARAAGPGAERR